MSFGGGVGIGGGVPSYLPAPLYGITPLRVLQIGDSMTREPIVRRAIQRELYQHTTPDRVQFVGSVGQGATTGGIIGSDDMVWWDHDGVNGNTIAQATARVPTISTALGASRAPHLAIVRLATNDISALRSLGDIVADYSAHIQALKAAWGNIYILLDSISNWRSGSASGGTWATKQALRNSFVALLPTIAAANQRCYFVDGFSGTAPGTVQPIHEIDPDGVHNGQDEDGYRRDGTRVAHAVLDLMGIVRQDRLIASATSELVYVPARRKAQSALDLPDVTLSRATVAADDEHAPDTGNIAFEVWFRCRTLPSGIHTIFGMSTVGGYATGYALAQDGDGLTFYLGSTTPVFSGSGGDYSDGILDANTNYHVAIVCDRSAGKVGMALNGKTIRVRDLADPAHGGLNWNLPKTGQTFFLGKFANNGIDGFIKGMAIYKGSQAPTIHELPKFAYQTYKQGIYWDGLSCLYRLNEGTGSPAEAVGATSALTLASGATWGTW